MPCFSAIPAKKKKKKLSTFWQDLQSQALSRKSKVHQGFNIWTR
jgi:hypothetical protein